MKPVPNNSMSDATTRFSNRVADYVRFRPGYPQEVVRSLMEVFVLKPEHAIAEIGSGTGIFTNMLLELGCTVQAVEPNAAMRAAAEEWLGERAGFRSVAGSAEATTLPDKSIDWIVAAQAFHWFDVERARQEAIRILRGPKAVALLWNNRREDTPFLAVYEKFLHDFSIDYAKVKHQNAESDGRIPGFLRGEFEQRTFRNVQRCDFDNLAGRTLSASYMPNVDHPRYAEMMAALRKLFDEFNERDEVVIEYDTRMYVGKCE